MTIRLWYRSRECAPSWVSDDEEGCTELTECYRRKHQTKQRIPQQAPHGSALHTAQMSWSMLGHVLSERTIIGWLQWWPPHPLFSINPYHQSCQTFIGPLLEFTPIPLPSKNHHSYHWYHQPKPHNIHCSIPRAPQAPHSFHVACLSHHAWHMC